MQIIDGRKIRNEMLVHIKKDVALLPFQPVFCDILVGEDASSVQYVHMKAKTAEAVGIHFHEAKFPATITTEDLVKEINILNALPNMCGIITQLPLPPSIDMRAILDAIDPELDVDCLGTVASSKFYAGDTKLGFPTALACMKVLDATGLDLKDKKIVVLGQGQLVGKPVTAMLGFRGITPETLSSTSTDKESLIKEADVIISGIGKGKYLTGDMIKEGVVLIDAGTSESGSGIVGDIDIESVTNKASFVSPVPGGVGPVTVASLLQNVLTVAQHKL